MSEFRKPTKDEIEGNPDRFRVITGGAIYDMKKKRIAANPGGGKFAITTDNARQLNVRKKQLAQQRAAEAIDEAAIEEGRIPQSAESGEGWKGVVKKVTKTLFTSENLRGQAEAARFLGQAAGYYNAPEDEERTPVDEVFGLIHELADLARAVTEARQQENLNGKVIANAPEAIDAEEITKGEQNYE